MMEKFKWAGVAVVVTLAVIIAFQNWQPAPIHILFFEPIEMPTIVVLFGTLVVGYLTGMVIGNPLRFLRKKAS